MIQINRYTLEELPDGAFLVHSLEDPYCPDCGRLMVGYDRRRRHLIDDSGCKVWFVIRRLRCRHCDRLHAEILNVMMPGRHYSSLVIQEAMRDASRCPAEDSTIRRWRK